MLQNMKRHFPHVFLVASALFLTACGGGGLFETENRKLRPVSPAPIIGEGGDRDQKNRLKTVAFIVPVKAPSPGIKAAAKDLRDAAKLAYDEISAKPIKLKIYETQGTVSDDLKAVNQALRENSDIILGPMLAPSVKAAGKIATRSDTPMIAFSSDRTALSGDNNYLLSFLPEQNISYVVDFAMKKGRTKFGALWPETPYGRLAASVFAEEISARGGELTASNSYNLNGNDFYLAVQEFAETDRRGETDKGIKEPPSWEAALLADDPRALMRVAPALERADLNLKDHLLIGTGVLNDPALKEIEELDGIIFASPDPRKITNFRRKFQEKYGRFPAQIGVLGYDGVALTAALAGKYQDDPYTEKHLTDPNGFDGASGIFRFLSNGTSERGLSVIQLQGKQFRVIQAAPTEFIGR